MHPQQLAGSVAGRLLNGYLVIVLLLAITWGIGALATRQINNRVTNAVEANDAVLSQVDERVKLMDDEETGLRGYLLTGDRRFLIPYIQARQRLAHVRVRPNPLVSEHARIRHLLGVTMYRAQAWDNWARALLRHPPADPRTSASIAAQRHGKHLFDEYRATADRVTQLIVHDRGVALEHSRRIGLMLNIVSGGIFTIALLTTLLVSWLNFRAVTGPLARLGKAAEVIGQGDLGHRVPESGDREFRRLAQQMNRMGEELMEHSTAREHVEAALRAQTARLSILIDTQLAITAPGLDREAALDLIVDRAQLLTGAAGAVIEQAEGNDLVYRTTSGTADAHLGLRLRRNSSLSGLCLESGEVMRCDDTEIDPRVDLTAVRRTNARSMIMVPLQHQGQSFGILKVTSPKTHAFTDQDVDALQVLSIQIAAARAVASHVRAQQTLLSERDHALTELGHINAELESFAYSVSHDLRAPLRSMDGFSEVLLDDYASALDARAVRYLNYIRDATREMGQLIDALLRLSRVSRSELVREYVDLSELAQEVVSRLGANYPERRVAVSIAPGMTDKADPRLLQAVFENLLSNAWKFTRKKETACIEVGGTFADSTPVYFVRDNGAGFDMAYVNKLFNPFQRLHNPRDFEGTGVGLATVRRIIHRHGGEVWVEAVVGEGATFYFTLHAKAKSI